MKGGCVVVYFPVRPESKWSCHLQGEDEGDDGTMVKKVDEPDGTMKAQAEGQQTFYCSDHHSLLPTP